jgi:hypothetical protein
MELSSNAWLLCSSIDFIVFRTLTQNWDEAKTIFPIWEKRMESNRQGDILPVDLIVGILAISISVSIDLNIDCESSFRHISNTLIPTLVNRGSVSDFFSSDQIQSFLHTFDWLSGLSSIPHLLLYWVWYIRDDLNSMARSKGSVPILIKLSILLEEIFINEAKSLGLRLIYGLIQGTLLKYLVFHNIESVDHIAKVDNQNLGDFCRHLFQSSHEMCDSLESSDMQLGLLPYILFEWAELESMHFKDYKKSAELIKRCLQLQEPGSKVQPPISGSASTVHGTPSFLRGKLGDTRSASRNKAASSSAGSDGSSSLSSSVWIPEPKISDSVLLTEGNSNRNIQHRCRNALVWISANGK